MELQWTRGHAVRAIWVVGPGDSFAPFSKRFPTVEHRWHRALGAWKQPRQAEDEAWLSKALHPLPMDADLVAALRSAGGPVTPVEGAVCSHVSWAPRGLLGDSIGSVDALGLWPLVRFKHGFFTVLVLPLVSVESFSRAWNAAGRGGLDSCSDLTSRLLLAFEIAQAVASLLPAEKVALSPERLAQVSDFINGALPLGKPSDTCTSRVLAPKGLGEPLAGEDPLPSWRSKPYLGKQQGIEVQVHEEITGVARASHGEKDGSPVSRVEAFVYCHVRSESTSALRGEVEAPGGLDALQLSFHHSVALQEGEPSGTRAAFRFIPPHDRFVLATCTPADDYYVPVTGELNFSLVESSRKVSFELELQLVPLRGGEVPQLKSCWASIAFPEELEIKSCRVAACSAGSTQSSLDEESGRYRITWSLDNRMSARSPRAMIAGALVHAHPKGEERVRALLGDPSSVTSRVHFHALKKEHAALQVRLRDVPLGLVKWGGVTYTSSIGSRKGLAIPSTVKSS